MRIQGNSVKCQVHGRLEFRFWGFFVSTKFYRKNLSQYREWLTQEQEVVIEQPEEEDDHSADFDLLRHVLWSWISNES